MATKLGQTVGRSTVDRSFFSVRQDPDAEAESGLFVGTAPGAITALCGRTHADVIVRLERWDMAPPLVSGWEDIDELPYLAPPGAGPARVHGLDPEPAARPLQLQGIGRAVVRVQARGRQTAPGYPDATPPPEEWLFQLYPDPAPDGTDPVRLGPRRLSGDAAFGIHRTPWLSAVDAWAQAGWEPVLGAIPGYDELVDALRAAGRPVSVTDVVAAAGVHVPGAGRTVPDVATRLPGLSEDGPTRECLAVVINRALRLTDASVSHRAEHPTLTSYGDLVELLIGLGLLVSTASNGHIMLHPNPAPIPAWEVDCLDEPLRHATRISALRDHERTAADIRTLLLWSPHVSTRTSARQLAVRLGTAPYDALGALRLLELRGEVRGNLPLAEIGVDDRVSIGRLSDGFTL